VSLCDAYANAYMVSGVDFKKSTSDYMMTFERGAMSCQFTLQICVALSCT